MEAPEFNWDDYAPIDASPEPSAFNWNDYSTPLDYETSTKPPQESTGKKIARGAFQIPLGYTQKYTYPADIAEMGAKGAAMQAAQDLSESDWINKLSAERYGHSFIPIDKQQVQEEATGAIGKYFPSQSNVERIIEESTGLPLTPQSDIDRYLRTSGMAAGFSGGSPLEMLKTAAAAGGIQSLAEIVGAPQWLSQLLALISGGVAKGKPSVGSKIEKDILKTTESLPKSTFETAENIARESKQAFVPPPPPPPPTFSIIPSLEIKKPDTKEIINPSSAKQLSEKITEASSSIPKEGKKSLSGRVEFKKDLPKSFEHAISEEPPVSSAERGRNLSNRIKENAKNDRVPVTEAYKQAEQITSAHADIYPDLAKKVDDLIAELESITRRNSGQEMVYQQAKAVRDLVGTSDGLLKQNARKLIIQSDSASQLANYELPYTGYKGKIKSLVKDINESVINSLIRSGKKTEAQAVIHADKLYSRWANKYLGDQISPYLESKNLHPESLSITPTKNPESYRAVKNAIGSRDDALINSIDRDIVADKLNRYYQDPKQLNTREYQKDLSNVQQLIGKDKAADVDYFLRKHSEKTSKYSEEMHKQSEFVRKHISEPGTKLTKKSESIKLNQLAEKISKKEKERISFNKEAELKYKHDLKRLKDQDRLSQKEYIQAKKAHEKLVKEEMAKIPDADSILGMLNSRSGIRELKKITSEQNFNTITKQKMRSILRENNIEKELTGDSLYRVLNNEKNYEIFSEIIGEQETEAARLAAKFAGKREIAIDTIKDLAKKKMILKFLGIVGNIL